MTQSWRAVAPLRPDAYRVYDQDEEHNRLRREIFAQICQDIARVQFQLDS
jgi:hypothetical protein